MREEREMMWFVGVRKELNFSNEVTEIPSARILLPRSMKCPKEKCSKGKKKKKKPIVAIKLLKFKGREEREKGLWQPSCRKWDEKKREKELWLEDSKWCFH